MANNNATPDAIKSGFFASTKFHAFSSGESEGGGELQKYCGQGIEGAGGVCVQSEPGFQPGQKFPEIAL